MTARPKPTRPKPPPPRPKCYLAGPMRGYDLFNFPAFHAAEADLTARGFDVHSPARYDEERGFDPALSIEEQGFDVEAALKHDIEVVATWAAYVFVLPGWEDSTGARLEVAVAQAIGVPVVSYETGASIQVSASVAVA